MQFIEIKESDKKLVSKTLNLLLKSSKDSIQKIYKSSNYIPQLEIIEKEIKEIKKNYGAIKKWTISDIQKRKYGHRDECYIESKLILITENDNLSYSIRLLTKDKTITSINFWQQKTKIVSNNFIQPEFYFFLDF